MVLESQICRVQPVSSFATNMIRIYLFTYDKNAPTYELTPFNS